MLQFLRKKGNIKKIMWVLAALIIPAFVLWGAGSAIRSKDQPKYAGRIFGRKVSFGQYEKALLACRNQALLIYGDQFNQVSKFLDLEKQAWEWLILVHQAKKEKIEVGNEELIQFIQKMPLFQEEGRFSQKKYGILLDYAFRTSPRDFEEQIRESLAIERLRNKIIEKVGLSDEETEKTYQRENEKVRVLYVFIDPQKFKEQVHPAYQELENYYRNHKSEFKRPEQVNVQYVALYLEQKQPEKQAAEEEKKDQAKKALEDRIWEIAYEMTEKTGSFEQAAAKYELEVKETGFFGPQQVIPEIGLSYEFLNTAFSLSIGEISNPIETPKGYFIIKIKEKKEVYIPVLEEIKQEVEIAVVQEKSWQLAEEKTKQLLAQIKDLMEKEKLDFRKAAERLSPSVKETEEFSRFSYISGIGQNVEFSQAAFSLKPGEASGLINLVNGYCILSPREIIPVDAEKFSQEKEEFAKKLLERKKDILYRSWLANLTKQANLENNIQALPK